MQKKKMFVIMITIGILLVVATGLWLMTAEPVSAQCGSQASSCKDCHEVQGQLSVNADGTGWHVSHAFGDFCYICHGGNTQATDKDVSHTGMVAPMDDVKASCQQCHPKDLEARAIVYATLLGVTPGGLDSAKPTEAPATGGKTQPVECIPAPANNIPVDNAVVLAQPAYTVDYVEAYNEAVLGTREPNWALIGFITLGVAAIVGLAVFIATKKGWVVVTFEKARKNEPKA
jgi:hypothetical protein